MKEEVSLRSIMEMVQKISGVKLGEDKRMLVETRLMRRARQLSMDSVEQYLSYFHKHQDSEFSHLISHLTTHTTEFFRELPHFEYLKRSVFPNFVKRNQSIKVWSAACSTGQEVYSLAMCYLEYLRDQNLSLVNAPKIHVLGTDIDLHSVEKAKQGVYFKEHCQSVPQDALKRYFNIGKGELENYVRIKDDVFSLCEFKQHNVLSSPSGFGKFDLIFLRNILIYFSTADVEKIANLLEAQLATDGLLFLGHSESLSQLSVPLKIVGNSIYQTLRVSGSSQKQSSSRETERARPVKVFIIDDSKTIRATLKSMLKPEFGFEVVGEAENPADVEKQIENLKPDVVTLDHHMPVMTGAAYLEKIQGKTHPPVVMLSSVSFEDAVSAFNCFELGVFDYIEKPNGLNINTERERILAVLNEAARTKPKVMGKKNPARRSRSAPVHISKDKQLIVIGSSTGGVEAVRTLLEDFPTNCPPTFIVQHIPAGFSKAFAKRMDELSPVKVCEASHGQIAEKGTVYIAPGGKQMKLVSENGQLKICVTDDAPVNLHKPSVDYFFSSVSELMPSYQVIASILTGMGADGAKELLKLRNKGAHTIAQDEESCVVFGMPKKAIEFGAATQILPLTSITYHIFNALESRKAA